jgi:hypothetical protein
MDGRFIGDLIMSKNREAARNLRANLEKKDKKPVKESAGEKVNKDLDNMNIGQLYKLAKSLNIEVAKGMTKADLIALIEKVEK